ncbi:MAG TPA: GMC family oxidoreductase N-terminal domain-containing protein [Candidatus Binatia bacterium]|nr:GMC family oxidoreductase N-terminal domain-containing protein [Candidatus Binatia bacterium]
MHDLIIVGAGTAGCVLAERLTRSGKLRVLLVEAGGKPRSRFVGIPAAVPKLFRTDLDWAFESEPQAAAAGRRIFTPRGRMLGGSANLNFQIHQWCHPADFEGWVAAGATGWGWNDVAPVFLRQENWRGADGQDARGRAGPMIISPNRNARLLSRAFVAAAREAGLGARSDSYNGGAYIGAWLSELAQKKGRRFSAYDAYLKPATRRPNLEVAGETHITKIVLEGNHAVGVAARRGSYETTYPCGGVVVAAGAFGSPQLLMLSGIGPAASLSSLGIPVRRDAPEVGANLQDHPVSPLTFRVRGTDTFKNAESPLNLIRYLALRRGMLASNGAEAIVFVQTQPGAVSAPDVELIFLPLEWRNQALEPPQIHACTLAVAVVAPRSRGRVALRSAEPGAAPLIDFKLLSDPDGLDAAALLSGARVARRIAATPPLALEIVDELRPGASVESDVDLLRALGAELQTVYHPAGTCRMGSDPRAVVDPKLRVQGMDRLWVADASVMPAVPRGHPNAVVAMIAERGAEWIESALVAGTT